MSFTEPEETVEETVEEQQEVVAETPEVEKVTDDVLDNIDVEDNQETLKKSNKKNTSYVFQKLIEKDMIVPFDDDKPLAEYSAKDWEELIDANLEEKANQVRNETPAKFFESLPDELKIAARYVFDGGKDLKGLFQTLAQVEETSTIDVKSERGQERVIQEYKMLLRV